MVKASESQYYTVPQAAQMLQISATTVRRWIQAGKLRAFRVGPESIRIRKEDLDAVITPFRPEPEVEPAAKPNTQTQLEFLPKFARALDLERAQ